MRTVLVFLSLICLAGCTGSPATLALRPAFEVTTPAGVASVSIRESPPGMTDGEFIRVVKAGMASSACTVEVSAPIEAPFPARRVVWHVSRGTGRGVSTLTVNIFDGSRPIAYEQEKIANDARAATVEAAVGSLTTRLIAALPPPEANTQVREAASRR